MSLQAIDRHAESFERDLFCFVYLNKMPSDIGISIFVAGVCIGLGTWHGLSKIAFGLLEMSRDREINLEAIVVKSKILKIRGRDDEAARRN